MKTWLYLILLLLPFFCGAQEELTLHTMTGDIYGTLLMPAGAEKATVVLLISGSGPTDRDGNNPVMKNNSLKMLADSLLSAGIGSLRYDKRGIAMSKLAGPDEKDLRFDDYIQDAVAWIILLRKNQRISKIIIAGHSEGSLIGMIAANRQHADGFISLAGAGRSADVILKEQLASQPENIWKPAYKLIDSLANNRTVQVSDPALQSLFRQSIQPYLISWFRYDPAAEIRKLKIPVLIVQGATDIQVSTDDATLLNDACPASRLSVIEGMNHILKNAPEDRQVNIATYSEPLLPLNQQLLKEVRLFLASFQN